MIKIESKRLGYLFIPLIMVTLDQLSKFWVSKNIGLYEIKYSFFKDLINIVHARNTGILFSIGNDAPEIVRLFLFIVLPCIFLFAVLFYTLFGDEVNTLQRVCLAFVASGGIGNIIDRIFRKDGVVDFIDVKFFGIFGLERWPTFNIADSCGVIFGIILVISIFFEKKSN